MSFRIESRVVAEKIVLYLHGQLVGPDAERILREQIVRAVSDQGHVLIDAGELTVFDPACLAVVHAGLGDWLTVEGGGAFLELLLRRK